LHQIHLTLGVQRWSEAQWLQRTSLLELLGQVLVLALVLLRLVLALVPAQVRVPVQAPLLLVLLEAPLQSEERGSRLPTLLKQQIFPVAFSAKALHSGPRADGKLMEEHNPTCIQLANIGDLVCTSMCIQDPCIDLYNLARIYCSSWVGHRALYTLDNLRWHMHQGKLLRIEVPHKTTYNFQPSHKLSHIAVEHKQAHRLDHTLLFHSPICTSGGNWRMSCREQQGLRLEELMREELVLLGAYYSEKLCASLRCGISSTRRSSWKWRGWPRHEPITKRGISLGGREALGYVTTG